MKKSLLFLSFFGLFSVATQAWSNDDVVVDLSVLGDVSTSAKPLVKQTSHVAKKNKSSVAAIPISSASLDKKTESSLVDLPSSEPKFPVVKVKPLIKPEVLKKVIVELKPVEQEDKDKLFEEVLQETKPVDVVSIQEKIEIVKIEKDVRQEELRDVAPIVEAPVVEQIALPEVVEVSVEIVSEESKPVEVKPIKLVEAKKTLPNNIYFGEDETELTDEHKVKLSQVMSSFKNQKIRLTIFSYTLNSDEDVHKRRLKSVTRAGEVRKHLISLGYKNSGMKIVNVDEDSGKVNTVEIVEVKP